jgi:hypothetical protein
MMKRGSHESFRVEWIETRICFCGVPEWLHLRVELENGREGEKG